MADLRQGAQTLTCTEADTDNYHNDVFALCWMSDVSEGGDGDDCRHQGGDGQKFKSFTTHSW